MIEPKVSVVIITYNHVNYIAQAIEGALMQETDFPYEIILGEDESQDGTREICVDYAERFPDKIRLFLRSRKDVIHINGCATGRFNFLESIKAAKGQYYALCEGDDYWTDIYKLQKQIEFLEANPQCSMCFHDADNLWPDGHRTKHVYGHEATSKGLYGLEDAVVSHFVPTASIVFRGGLVDMSHPLLLEAPTGDWLLRVMLAERGLLAFIDGNWAVRHVHPGGRSSMQPVTTWGRQRMVGANIIDRYLKYRYTHLLRPEILSTLVEICTEEAFSTSSSAAVEETIRQYSDQLQLTRKEWRAVVGESYFRLMFRVHQRGDTDSTRFYWWNALQSGYSPALRNRGFWSLGLDAVLGPAAAPVHRLLRRF